MSDRDDFSVITKITEKIREYPDLFILRVEPITGEEDVVRWVLGLELFEELDQVSIEEKVFECIDHEVLDWSNRVISEHLAALAQAKPKGD